MQTLNGKQGLDDAVMHVLQALRELECDNDIVTNSMEDNVLYIFAKVLDEVYGSNKLDMATALGVTDQLNKSWWDNMKIKFTAWK